MSEPNTHDSQIEQERLCVSLDTDKKHGLVSTRTKGGRLHEPVRMALDSKGALESTLQLFLRIHPGEDGGRLIPDV